MGCHVGFQKEAPECVAWSGSSYIEPVLPIEECSNRHITSTFFILSVICFALSFFAFSNLDLVGKIPPFSLLGGGAVAVPLFLLLVGFCFSVLNGCFAKFITIRKFRRRSGLLFEPDGETFFVLIEDALSYDKKKLSTEDAGLLFIGDEEVMLEMDRYRTHIKKSDLVVSLLHTAKNSAGVRLTVNHGHYPWSVVLSPLGNFVTDLTSAKRAGKLLDNLVEAGVPTAESFGRTEHSGGLKSSDELDVQEPTPDTEPVVLAGDKIIEDDITEKRYRDIAAILEQNKNQKKGWIKTVGILVISLLVFLQLGFLNWGFEMLMLILLGLVIHEMGHFIGMKMFGYKNVKMFFIPMLGAAVSGESRNTAAWKKALVTLMGPLPGILISLPLLVVHLITDSVICYKVGMMFLLLNLLNLLPIFPLDGGRFLHEVLFSRNRYIEMVVNIITAAVLLIAGLATKSWFLGFLGFINIAGLTSKFKLAGKSKEMKENLLCDPMNAELIAADEDNIPEHVMKHMINWIHQHMPGAMGHKNVATIVQQMWERVRISPPGAGATVGLISIFMAGYFVSLLSCGVLAVSYYKNNFEKTEIVEFVDPNGMTRYKEQSFIYGELWDETELSDDKKYYHGSYKQYDEYDLNGKVSTEGQWEMGIHVGVWKYYDEDGELYEEEHYKDGKIVLVRSILEDGQWEEESWDDLPSEQKESYEKDADFKYGPGKFPEYEQYEYTSDFDSD